MNAAHESSGPKVNLGEYLVVMQAIGVFELLDLTDVAVVTKFISYAGTAFYFIYSYQRGLPNATAIAASVIDGFPIIGWLPLRMAGYTVSVLMANNPELVRAAGTAGKIAAVAGAVTSAGGAASAGAMTSTGGAAAAGATTSTASATAGGTAATRTSTASAGSSAGGVTTRTATGTTTSTAGGGSAPSTGATSTSGGTPQSGAAQYAQEVQQEQDSLLQLNKQLTQQTPGTIDRPSGGRDDVAVDDDTNTVQLPYTA